MYRCPNDAYNDLMMEWVNSEQGITVLRTVFLVVLLVWLLSNGFTTRFNKGFNFFGRRGRRDRRDRRDKNKQSQRKEDDKS